ncbi:hypothetical protein QBC46DRAFT_3758 [Diplogelasinospora grovesii]|uniref:Uncharacterized protein n=1 Tax=Diplogelasinospora grovesii TaxID=303347 RepID=A0AAN6NI57_9PEZI|nr:hypothetical protein QBC46DRAFT_3758 [Diplogelasinospora grovesii]
MNSYRPSSDAYSRRPSDDRRDSYQPRRENYGRGGPEHHRDDRYRDAPRDRDSSPRGHGRDRAPQPETSRVVPKAPSSVASTSAGTVKQDQSATPAAVPDLSANCDIDNLAKAIANTLTQFRHVIVDEAKLTVSSADCDKVHKQKQAEHEKTMHKHAEFASVPELQNKYRSRDDKIRKDVAERLQKTQDRADKVAEGFASQLSQAVLRVVDEHIQQKDKEAESRHASLVERIDKYASEVQELKANLTRQQESFKSEFIQQRDEVKEQLQQIRKESTSQEAKQPKAAKEEDGTRDALQHVQEQLKRNQEQQQKLQEQLQRTQEQQRKMQERLQELREGQQKLQEGQPNLQEQLRELRKGQPKIQEQLQKLQERHPKMQEQLQELQQRQPQMQEQLQGLQASSVPRSELSSVNSRLDELTNQVAQRNQEAESTRLAVESYREKVEAHEAKLICIDVDSLDDAADAVTIHIPALYNKINDTHTKLDDHIQKVEQLDLNGIRTPIQALQTTQQALGERMNEFDKGMGELYVRITDQIKHIDQKLKAQPSGSHSSTTSEGPERSANSLEARLQELRQDHGVLSARLDQKFDSVQKEVQKEIDRTAAFFNHQIVVINSHIGNLPSKSLPKDRTGDKEKNNSVATDLAAVAAALEYLKYLVQQHETRVAKLEGVVSKVEQHETRINKLEDGPVKVEQLERRSSQSEGVHDNHVQQETRIGELNDASDKLKQHEIIIKKLDSVCGDVEQHKETIASFDGALDKLERHETTIVKLKGGHDELRSDFDGFKEAFLASIASIENAKTGSAENKDPAVPGQKRRRVESTSNGGVSNVAMAVPN